MNQPPPWYRQFWPWFLFGLPAIVVVAGLTTWWIAATHSDHLVADDYYRDGLAVNREMAKEAIASQLGIRAEMEATAGLIRVRLSGRNSAVALQLFLSHPFDANKDQQLRLAQVQDGIYEAVLIDTPGQRWLWRLEPLAVPASEHWRVDGELSIPAANER
jgi:hypothetical protein